MHQTSPTYRLRLHEIRPLHRPHRLLNKIRPPLNHPHKPARHLPPHHDPHPRLLPHRHDLHLLLYLFIWDLPRLRVLARQILQDGGAQRAHGVAAVEDDAFAVGGYVADGVDAGCGGAQGGEVGLDAVGGGEPGGGEPGGVGGGAGGVDVDVYGCGGVIGEGDDGFVGFLLGGEDAEVVFGGDAEFGELGFRGEADGGAEAG